MTLLMVNLSGQFMNQEDVFVAMNLLWYAQEGEPTVRQDPDVMVSFGRPKGERGSYRQWLEGGIAPQVVFEIVTPGLPQQEISDTYRFYEEHGVEEYYAFIPDTNIWECRCPATTSGRCYKVIRKNECNKCQPLRLRRETMPRNHSQEYLHLLELLAPRKLLGRFLVRGYVTVHRQSCQKAWRD